MLRLSPALRAAGHAVTALLAALMLVPMLLTALAAFKPPPEIFDLTPWPVAPTLANFERLLAGSSFALALATSLCTTVLRVAGQVTLAVLAAYAFARFTFRGRDALFVLVLGGMMVPHALTMIPIYLMIARLGWFDTWAALVVPNLAFPFGVFLLRQHMLAFPRELTDAATVDGCGPLRALVLVILPNLGPALAGLTIVAAIECWNEYLWPLLVTDSERSRTVQVMLRRLLDAEGLDGIGPLMAGVTLASLPALALFLVLQRRVLETFVASGIK